jgi:hypothetical protein
MIWQRMVRGRLKNRLSLFHTPSAAIFTYKPTDTSIFIHPEVSNRMFAETSRSHHSTTRLKSKKPNLKHFSLRCSGTSTFASCAYFCREFYTLRNRLTVCLLFDEESDLERIGDVTDVTLVTSLTVAGCTDTDTLCTVDLSRPIDQTKRTSFRYQIIDKSGPVAISPVSSLALEF